MKGRSPRKIVPSHRLSRRQQNRKLLLERLEDRALLATFSVVNTAASGTGSLRQAILDANASAGADYIVFNIPANDVGHLYYKNDGFAGRVTTSHITATTEADDSNISDIDPDWAHSWYRIKPTTALALPAITGPVVIDGYTQPGAIANSLPEGDNALLRIQLEGGPAALVLSAGSSTIRGLNLEGTGTHAITLQTQGGNVIEGSFIGTDISGTVSRGNATGVRILGSSDNVIGGTTAAARNLISSNGSNGILITDSTTPAARNRVVGNFIGTDISGTVDRGNGHGIQLLGASDNVIGGTTPEARNVISGSSGSGVLITDSTTAPASNNVILGNFIGTDRTGTTDIRNDAGVRIFNAQHNIVGGTAPGSRNIISGNLRGIVIEDQGTTAIEGFNVVEGNYIGLDVTGTHFLSNGYQGIYIVKSDMNRIGGTAPGARNIISGNGQHAIRILGHTISDDPYVTTGNVIQGNWFGTDSAGNGLFHGIINSSIDVTLANDTLIGGTDSGEGNIFAYAGINVHSSFNTVIQGNIIGETAHGAPAGYNVSGVAVLTSWNTQVGGTETGAGNVIANGGSIGVSARGDVYPAKWWRAEQSAVETINNSTLGTLHGGVSFSQGKHGYAFAFDGVDDYVEWPDVGVDAGSLFAIEAWVQPNRVDQLQQMLSKFGPGGNAYQLGVTANGALQAQVFVSGVIHTLQSAPGALRVGEWAHVGLTYNSTAKTYTLYLNGVAVDSRSGLGLISSNSTTPLSFGRKSDGTEYFDGLIDEVAISLETTLGNRTVPLHYRTGGVNEWHGTSIRGNNIFNNHSLGIDLNPSGPNPTDPSDIDFGANDKQNVPEILSATSDGTQVTVQGVLRSIAFATHELDFFANSLPPGANQEIEGERFIGFGTVVTDDTGTANFEFTFDAAVPVDYLISTTATVMSDHDSNPDTPMVSIATSEFSGPKLVAPKTGGRIQGFKFNDANSNGQFDSGEHGLFDWTIYLDANNNGLLDTGERRGVTSTNGAYAFTNLAAGTYYVREVQKTGWTQTTPEVVEVVVTDPQTSPIYTVHVGNHRVESLVSGLKFHDLDGDGTRDAGEPGLSGFAIYIDANGNDERDSGELATVSDINGVWGFENLPAGTYRIREVQRTGLVQTTPLLADVTLTANGQSADAGVIGNYRLATVSGAKFNDRNADGEHQLTEPGLFGWTIYIDANDNGQLDVGEPSDTTNQFGAYSFSGLGAGSYIVREVQQDGWEQTTEDVTVEVLPNQSGQEYTVLVGNFRPSSIIGGLKFHDQNGNGARDAGEPGLANWTITLDIDADGLADRSTITNANGEYSFTGLPSGTYRVREVQDAGWVQTTDNPADIVINDGGQVIAGPSFGNYRLATISGVKFCDRNNNGVLDPGENGLEGWTIFLDGNDNGLLDDGEESDVTNLDGAYSFHNLVEGEYRVREVQQPGWTQTSPKVITVVVPNQSAQSHAVNVGNFELGSIDGGVKYHDLNGNGLFDANEPGLPGWMIYLDRNENAILDADERRTVSDVNGRWSFRDLPAGSYHVRELQEHGWVQTSAPVELTIATSGQSVTDAAIGNYRLATIHGVKFNDTDSDGILDLGETGLEGWTIFLDSNDNGEFDAGESHTTTNLFGGYSFSNLDAGTYRVREVQQPGWTQTSANVTTAVVPNQSAQSYVVNVGNFQLGTMEGVKFHDYNGNGHRDANEPGLPGWTIYLDENGNDGLDVGEPTSVTDLDGKWSFGNLPAGNYHVREVQQTGWVQTSAPLDLTLSTSGQSLTGEIGNFRLATITGVKFHDLNGNAERDPGEPGIEGWQIFLDLDGDDALDANERSTSTNVFGVYYFTNVGPGTWTAREVQDPGWLQTTANPPSVTVTGLQQTFAGGDFGNKLGSLSGSVYIDADNDGVFDVDEDGVGNAFVTLTGTDDLGPVTRAVLTDVDGFYKFGGLRPGSYQIIETQPSSYLDGQDTLGSLGHTVTDDQFFVDLEKGEDGTDYDFGELEPATLSGYVYDDQDDDGEIDFGEPAISGVAIHLTGINDLNQIIDEIVNTDTQGYYEFGDLRPGTYAITEQHPVPYIDGKDTVGTLGGTATNDQLSAIPVVNGSNGINYNFAEHLDAGLKRGQTATIGFWQNKNGQKLLLSLNGGANSTSLGNWLATNFANLYGANAGANNLAGKTNAEIADYYIRLFKQKGQKLDAQVLAAAFAVYVTDTDLAETNAAQYGFIVNSAGTGAATFNVGSSGAAFGVGDNSRLTILQILTATNALSSGGNLYNGNTNLRNQAIRVYDGINRGGDIL